MCCEQVKEAGPSTPEEYAQELEKFNFPDETASEAHHSTIDKLRVSLSTNGLRLVLGYVQLCVRVRGILSLSPKIVAMY